MAITISEDLALDLLLDELDKWHPNDDVRELFARYYEQEISSGVYDNGEFDPMSIVDNDWVNWKEVITKSEFEDYDIENEDDDRIICKYGNLYLIDVT